MTRARCTALFYLLGVAATLPGCTAAGPSGRTSPRGSAAAPPASVDPARAYLSLSRIEPKPEKPARAAPAKPLSARAERQVAKARRLMADERYTEAAIALERALRYDPNHPTIHHTLATLHWKAGNFERAKSHAARAAEINPDDATAHFILGRYHAQAGDRGNALREYRTALWCHDLDEKSELAARVHLNLAGVLAAEGYLEAALEQYDAFEASARALTASGDGRGGASPAWLRSKRLFAGASKAAVLEKLDRFAEAADTLAPWVEETPDEVPLVSRYVRLLLRADRARDALAALRRLPIQNDEVVELLYEAHRLSGHPERVIDDLRLRMTQKPEDARLVLSLAKMSERLGFGDPARRELERFLEAHPDDHAVRAALVDALVRSESWLEAWRVCAEGVERSTAETETEAFEAQILALSSNGHAVQAILDGPAPEPKAAARYLQGALARAVGRLDRAETQWEKVLDDRPTFLPARVALARLYLEAYRYDEAIQVASGGDEDIPEDARLEKVLGEVYDRLDDPRTAERHFQAAIQMNRSDAEAMLALARLYHRSGQRLQAQRQLQVLLEKHPDHEAARELLAFSYLDEGKLDVAVEQLEELERRARRGLVKARCRAFLDQVHNQDRETYRRTLQDAMERYGPDADTWLAIAQSYADPRDLERKHRAFVRAKELDPDSEEAAIGVIDTARGLLDFEEAVTELEALLRRRPNRHAWRLGFDDRRSRLGRRWPGLIELYWIIQDYDAALGVAEDASARKDLDSATRRAYRLAILETLREAHRDREALERVKAWAAAEPQTAVYSTLLALEYLRQDLPRQAVPLLTKAYESNPDRSTLRSLVTALTSSDRYDRAAQYLLEWIDTDPENDTAVAILVSLLSDAGRREDAVELARNRLLHSLDRQRFQNLIVAALSQAKAYEEALELVEALQDTVMTLMESGPQRAGRPDEPVGEDQRAHLPNEPFTPKTLHGRLLDLRDFQVRVLLGAKRYDQARRQLTSWLDETGEPLERFEYLRRLALCYRGLGDEAQASEMLSRALVLQPGHLTLNNDVAYGWIDRGVRLDEAADLIRFALSRSPRQGAYLDTYGWLLYKKGAFASAKKWLLRASHVRHEKDPVILDHVGDTLWRLGESEEALVHWRAAVASARERAEDEVISADERRVRGTTPQKIEAVRAGRVPPVAPLGVPAEEKGGGETAPPHP